MHVVNDRGVTINTLPPKIAVARDLLEEMFKPVIAELEKSYHIPIDLAKSIIDHSIKLMIKHKDWKPEKIARKTAGHFRLKRTDKQ